MLIIILQDMPTKRIFLVFLQQTHNYSAK